MRRNGSFASRKGTISSIEERKEGIRLNVSKLTVLKGRTLEHPKNKWSKVELTIEILLTEKEDPELAKELADLLLDSWLKKEGEK